MEQLAGYDYVAIKSDKEGNPEREAAIGDVVQAAAAGGYTDVVLLAHGFRNDEQEASRLYRTFLENFRVHQTSERFRDSLAARRLLAIGVFWPSKRFSEGPDDEEPAEGGAQSLGDADTNTAAEAHARAELARFREETSANTDEVTRDFEALLANPDDTALQDRFVRDLLASVEFADEDGTEGLAQLRQKHGSDVLASLAVPIFLPTVRSDREGGVTSVGGAGTTGAAADGGVLSVGKFFGSVAGRVGQLLNMGSWYTMKARAGAAGARMVAPLVRALRAEPALSSVRIHLVGHSLGGRLMAATARALATAPTTHVDSLTLLEAAFSHYGFCTAVPDKGGKGFFRAAIDERVVRGPFVSTYSYKDKVVGKAYSIASRLAGDNSRAIGDAKDPFGGIGRNGAQETAEWRSTPLAEPTEGYTFELGKINGVDGSDGGIADHGDVTNPRVTNAFACAVAMT